jgi:tRNA ligase
LRNTEPLNDGEADETIKMAISEDIEQTLSCVIDGVVRVLGLPSPELECVSVALPKARPHKPTLTGTKQAMAKMHPEARYFGLLPEIDLVDALDVQISRHQERGMPLRDFWEMLKSPREHMALSLWERCATLHAPASPLMFRAHLGHVVANERIMVAMVEDLCVGRSGGGRGAGGHCVHVAARS